MNKNWMQFDLGDLRPDLCQLLGAPGEIGTYFDADTTLLTWHCRESICLSVMSVAGWKKWTSSLPGQNLGGVPRFYAPTDPIPQALRSLPARSSRCRGKRIPALLRASSLKETHNSNFCSVLNSLYELLDIALRKWRMRDGEYC
jgi:hypothetical protein